MSAREEILNSVRRALSGADRTAPHVPRGYRTRPASDGLLDLFVERVQDYRAVVVRVPADGVEQAAADALAGAPPSSRPACPGT